MPTGPQGCAASPPPGPAPAAPRRRSTGCPRPPRPAACAIAATSATRRVFPTPAPPRTSTMPRRPRRGGPPHLLEHAQLGRPADQLGPPPARCGRRTARRRPAVRAGRTRVGASAAGTPGASQRPGPRPAHAPAPRRSGGRCSPPRPVAQVGLQLHQRAVADLLQRLQLDPAPGGIHRPGAGHRPGPGPRRPGRTAPRTAAQAAPWPRAASRRTRPAAGRPGTRRSPRRRARQRFLLAHPPPRPPGQPSARWRRRARRRGMSGVIPAQVPGRYRQRGRRRPGPGASDAVRGAGWSVPVRRSTRATAGRRSAAAPGRTRRAREEGDQGNGARRPAPDATALVVGDRLLPEDRHPQHADCSPAALLAWARVRKSCGPRGDRVKIRDGP